MPEPWVDKTIVVTGGSSGLGLAIARQFAKHGAHPILVARNQDRLQQVSVGFELQQLPCTTVAADITQQDDVLRAFDEIRSSRSSIDVLVNCAGKSSRNAILETTADDFQELWELNFLATVRCTRAAAPDLVKARGHVVNIGSLASKTASRYLGAYPATKFAVAAYSQQLRLELEPQGLHVMLVCPGPMRRDDAGQRYEVQAEGLPDSARKPGGGAKVKLIDPDELARRIVEGCQRRVPEIVIPSSARWLFGISQLWPSVGDWILKRKT